jgi:hypothetical protein
VKSNEIVIGISVNAGGGLVDFLDVLSVFDGTVSATLRRDTTLWKLAIGRVGSGAAVVEGGERTLILLHVKWQLLARRVTSNDVLLWLVKNSKIDLADSWNIFGGRAQSEWKLRGVNFFETATFRGTVALVVFSVDEDLVRDGVAIDLRGIEPGGGVRSVASRAGFATPSGFKERINGRSASSSGATSSREVLHLVSNFAVATIFVTVVFGPETGGGQAIRGNVVSNRFSSGQFCYRFGFTRQ